MSLKCKCGSSLWGKYFDIWHPIYIFCAHFVHVLHAEPVHACCTLMLYRYVVHAYCTLMLALCAYMVANYVMPAQCAYEI